MAPGIDDPRMRALIQAARAFATLDIPHTMIGGWTPALLLGPGGHGTAGWDHVGSVDIDFVVDPTALDAEGRERLNTMLRSTLRARPRKIGTHLLYLEDSFDMPLEMPGGPPSIQLDVMGANVLPNDRFDWLSRVRMAIRHSEDIILHAPDGDVVIRVISAAAFVLTKAIAMIERAKPKDAFDVYTMLRFYRGGPQALAREIADVAAFGPPAKMALRSLRKRFSQPLAAGPSQLVEFSASGADPDAQRAMRDDVVRLFGDLFDALDALTEPV